MSLHTRSDILKVTLQVKALSKWNHILQHLGRDFNPASMQFSMCTFRKVNLFNLGFWLNPWLKRTSHTTAGGTFNELCSTDKQSICIFFGINESENSERPIRNGKEMKIINRIANWAWNLKLDRNCQREYGLSASFSLVWNKVPMFCPFSLSIQLQFKIHFWLHICKQFTSQANPSTIASHP